MTQEFDIYAERRELYRIISRLENRITTLNAETVVDQEAHRRKLATEKTYYENLLADKAAEIKERDDIIIKLKRELERLEIVPNEFWAKL